MRKSEPRAGDRYARGALGRGATLSIGTRDWLAIGLLAPSGEDHGGDDAARGSCKKDCCRGSTRICGIGCRAAARTVSKSSATTRGRAAPALLTTTKCGLRTSTQASRVSAADPDPQTAVSPTIVSTPSRLRIRFRSVRIHTFPYSMLSHAAYGSHTAAACVGAGGLIVGIGVEWGLWTDGL